MSHLIEHLKKTRHEISKKCIDYKCQCIYDQLLAELGDDETKIQYCTKYWKPESKWRNDDLCSEFGFLLHNQKNTKIRVGQQKQKKY